MRLNSRFYIIRCAWIACLLFAYQSSFAQEKQEEMVPIALPEVNTEQFNQWMVQQLQLWGTKVAFPDTPFFSSKEIYTEKGLVPESNYKWEDYQQTVLFELSSHQLPEKLNDKNEKKLVDAVVQRLAIIHGGYPELSGSTLNPNGIKSFELEIRTIKKQQFRAKIYMFGEQVLVASALLMQSTPDVRAQVTHFFKSISFNPLPGEIVKEVPVEKKGIFSKTNKEEATWENLETDKFSLHFPKYPASLHKLIQLEEKQQTYYQWHMADTESGLTYLLALIPQNSNLEECFKTIEEGFPRSLSITASTLVSKKNLEYFLHPGQEVLFKSEQQFFRVRYFCDGHNLYQLVVSGKEIDMFSKSANRFLDGLKWR